MTVIKRMISFVLSILIIISVLVFDISATDNQKDSRDSNIEDIISGVASPYEVYDEISSKEVPIAVGYENAKSKLHVQRLYDKEESLNSVLFENIDGTVTEYYFGYPVKYNDSKNNIKDITFEIVEKENSIITSFSKELKDGISISSKDISITMIPNVDREVMEIMNDDIVIYKVDDITAYEYKLTYRGYKEDIVVSEYNDALYFPDTYYFLYSLNHTSDVMIRG